MPLSITFSSQLWSMKPEQIGWDAIDAEVMCTGVVTGRVCCVIIISVSRELVLEEVNG
jgi:hypothetical protein